MSSPAPIHLSRRRFLAAGAATAAGVVGAGGLPAAAGARPRVARPGGPMRARNLIFIVSDGMSIGTLTLAHMARLEREGRASHWVDLWNRPGVRRAAATTSSADAHVTDSAAGGSAWACGVHVCNGVLNIDPQGRQKLPLLPHARQAGRATGVVTTTRVTHATPASFAVNVPTRDMEDRIAEEMLDRGLDVMLGGGRKHFPAGLVARHGAALVASRAELLAVGGGGAAKPGRLLGLFSASHMPYELDRPDTVPTLAEMTRVALERLDRCAPGFVLQVEGGRVDHAAHNNDAASLIADQLALDDAIGVAVDFATAGGRDDTLVILTTDHGNANPGLTLYGQRGKDAFTRLLKATRSFEFIESRAGGDPSRIPAGVEEAFGITLGAAEAQMVIAAARKQRVMPFADMNGWMSVLGQVLASQLGVAFTSPNHTADMVEVTALGPGSAALRPFVDNVELHALAVSALGLPEPVALPGMDRIVPASRRTSDD